MTSPKRAATYIGRIGGLAIALGVGHALASGTAVASADTADQGSATAHQSASSTNTSATRRAPRAATVRKSAHPQSAAVTAAHGSAALTAWTRRDITGPGARSVAARAAATSSAAVTSTPTNLSSTPTGWVTGQRNSAYPGASWAQINNTSWANVYGTDVGVMWFNGVNGKTQLAFGDTFSGPNMSGNWRSNVLLLSEDTQLYDGLTLENTGPATQFIPAAPRQVFFIGSEVTNIPSSAVFANGEKYVNYFSV